ncbi:hypothetical protein IW492_14045 [Enterococcus sp. BWB1-3]|uniref:hypothetical protein n=1 Tax=unclassified Enterococcus TaxID=2608891 RepID=UPI0019223103|nr:MULTISPECIES: hypothetical protein [unclassified Enterococcus]MBL1230354.1 hypothetical protein [Enterococcus sp. BWB1-3]MCB5951028.1 hypothetical protein [Enterococcus sp. BWT-B8]
MQEDYTTIAQDFLASLTKKEKIRLYNDLLALKTVHHMNQDHTYYTFKNIKRGVKKYSERRKRCFNYVNDQQVELMINQIHEQHFFKNGYRIEVYLAKHECSYAFIECLLQTLQENPEKSFHMEEVLA